jgi:hypothetical protein
MEGFLIWVYNDLSSHAIEEENNCKDVCSSCSSPNKFIVSPVVTYVDQSYSNHVCDHSLSVEIVAAAVDTLSSNTAFLICLQSKC